MRIPVLAIAGTLMLAACATQPPPEPPPPAPVAQKAQAPAPARRSGPTQLKFDLASGAYHCDQGYRVHVQRYSDRRIEVSWQGDRHTMVREASSSGLPRYEDDARGLVWIDLPWKSVLLNARTGRPIANDCKPA